MKKILILFSVIVIGIAAAFAYNCPRWKVMPIRVYVPQYGDFSKLTFKAFEAWQQKSGGLVRFKYVNRASDAEIYVAFVERVNCGSVDNAVGCAKYESMTNGFFNRVRVEIGTNELIYNADGTVYGTKPSTRPRNNLYGVMLHEIGHALGFEHSKDKNSIMYPSDLQELQYLTNEDLKLITEKYR